MATSFGEPSVNMLIYSTRLTELHQVKAGDRIEHDGRVYRVFRFLPMARPHKPLGCVAIAARLDAAGNALPGSVALCFDDANEVVRRVLPAAPVEVKR